MTETAESLSNSAQSAIADALAQTLAETAVTTMLAQNFHWNVKGMSFGALHVLFQQIYDDHFIGQDDLAERIRALGVVVDGQLAAMLKRSAVKEHAPDASDKMMVKVLADAQETLAATAAKAGKLAAEQGDALTEDLCIARGTAHEKFAWMLRAHLG